MQLHRTTPQTRPATRRVRLRAWSRNLALALLLAGAAPLLYAQNDLRSSYDWEPVRIGGGGLITGLSFSFGSGDVRYARTDVGGAYRFDGNNDQWVQIITNGSLPGSATRPDNIGVEAIAADPGQGTHVVMAYGGVIYGSNDGGNSWWPSNLSVALDANNDNGKYGTRFAFSPTHGDRLYYGSESAGLWRSTDGGHNYDQVSGNGAPDTGANVCNVIFSEDGNTVYAAVRYGDIYRSTDDGNSWQNISAGVSNLSGTFLQNAAINQAGDLFFTGNGLWRYSGGSWQQVVSAGIVSVAIDPGNEARVFALADGGEAYRSLSGGAPSTWTNLGGAQRSSFEIPWLQETVEGYFSNAQILFGPAGSNTLYIAEGIGVWYTQPDDNSGGPLTWISQSRGVEELVSRQVIVPPGSHAVVAVEDRTGFYIDNPDVYSATQSTLQGPNAIANGTSLSYCPNSPNYVAAISWNFQGGNFSGDYTFPNYPGYSNDGGQTWTRFGSIVNGNHPAELSAGNIAVSARPSSGFSGDNLVWIPQGDFAPFYSLDGGNTWSQSHSFDGLARDGSYDGPYTKLEFQHGIFNAYVRPQVVVADVYQVGRFYLYLNQEGVWRTDDGGVNWTQLSGNDAQVTGTAFSGQFATTNVSGELWFAGGYQGATRDGLWHSYDGGSTFTQIANVGRTYSVAVGAGNGSPIDAVYFSGEYNGNYGIYRSTDQGASWDLISDYPTGIIAPAFSLGADPDHFGVIYAGVGSQGFVYGKLR